jgi:hypothetical protein
MISIKYRRLDKLRLLRRYTNPSSLFEFNETLAAANTFVEVGDLKKIKESHRTVFWKRYKGNDESTGLSIIFFSVQQTPAISIELTPRKLSQDDWVDAKSLLLLLGLGLDDVWKKFKVAAVEVAMDVNIPFKDMLFLAPGVKTSSNNFLAAGTLYLGSQNGNRHYRLYDKQKHLKDKKNKVIDTPLTRIEAIHQGLGIYLDDLHTLENPYGKLIAMRKTALDKLTQTYPTDFELGFFCMRVVKQGATGHDAYWEQEPTARKRIVKILRPHSLNLNGKQEDWTAWIKKQQEKLKKQFHD